jgi:hypothetical protein
MEPTRSGQGTAVRSGATGALIGREQVVSDVETCLAAGRSVLLVGPEGSGKTAIIDAIRRPGLLVVDPFAGITSPRACAIRRALNRGAIVLAAARSLELHDMGHLGRIFWRLQMIRLRPLSGRDIARVVERPLEAPVETAVPVDRRWMAEAIDAAAGLPGRAVALASVVAARWQERRVALPPRFALVIARQDGLAHLMDRATTRGLSPGGRHHERDWAGSGAGHPRFAK